jgi:hypothetical protein
MRGLTIIDKYSVGDPLRTLYLRNGEFAVLRFLTSARKTAVVKCHDIRVDEEKNLWGWVYCPEDESCQYCGQNLEASDRMIFRIYVYEIYHTAHHPHLDKNSGRWSTVKVNGQAYFKETLNKPMLLKVGFGLRRINLDTLVGFAKTYGDLNDRPYVFQRMGGGMKDTVYGFWPGEAEAMSQELLNLKAQLPELEELVTHRTAN